MPSGIMGSKSLKLTVSSKKEGEIMNTRVCGVSFYSLKHLELQS